MKNAITKWHRMLLIVLLTVSCAEPTLATQSPTAAPNPSTVEPPATAFSAPITGGATGLSLSELKYRLLKKYPNFFFCDPDFFPVVLPNEQGLAAARLPEIQKDTEKYQAILKHTKLEGRANLSNSQKLIVYREFKKLNALILDPSGEAYKFWVRVRTDNDIQAGLVIEGTITKTGEITVSKSEPTVLTCPICLATNTMIDTPSGPRAVQDLQEGMSVWTLDAAGRPVAAHVIQAARVRAPMTHRVARLRLDDGRELLGSPGHPTADGRTLAQLQPGDALDGARVLSAKLIRYTDDYTYDILPSGSTGAYWANGILLGSTLRLHIARQHMRPDGKILLAFPHKDM